MGLFKGAETCNLIGCYLLSHLTKKYAKKQWYLSHDGLSVFNKTPQKIERIKKDLCKIFHNSNLKITVEASLTRANFLDVTLALTSGKHFLYTKEGNTPLYVHKRSNHPPSIPRDIPESINKHLSEILSDKEYFHKPKNLYQDALNKTVLQRNNP